MYDANMRSPLVKPEPTKHPVDVGHMSEAAILSELVKRGYRVLTPFGVNQRYDLVLETDGRFLRAQCKTGRLRKGVVLFSTRSVQSNRNRIQVRGYKGEVDLFLVFCPENEAIYAIPAAEASIGSMGLRVDRPRNGQLKGVRWARDFELPA